MTTNDCQYSWIPLPCFLLRHHQFYPAILLQMTKKLVQDKLRFKTAIQYFKVLWLLHQYLPDCQVFIHKNKDSCRFVDAETRKTSKTASSAKAMELPFCNSKTIICSKILTQPSGLQLNLWFSVSVSTVMIFTDFLSTWNSAL